MHILIALVLSLFLAQKSHQREKIVQVAVLQRSCLMTLSHHLIMQKVHQAQPACLREKTPYSAKSEIKIIFNNSLSEVGVKRYLQAFDLCNNEASYISLVNVVYL